MLSQLMEFEWWYIHKIKNSYLLFSYSFLLLRMPNFDLLVIFCVILERCWYHCTISFLKNKETLYYPSYNLYLIYKSDIGKCIYVVFCWRTSLLCKWNHWLRSILRKIFFLIFKISAISSLILNILINPWLRVFN